ncbi:MAG: hypothetical protein ACFFG0_02450 [Candidatus Thorarchaeota archaeon]
MRKIIKIFHDRDHKRVEEDIQEYIDNDIKDIPFKLYQSESSNGLTMTILHDEVE